MGSQACVAQRLDMAPMNAPSDAPSDTPSGRNWDMSSLSPVQHHTAPAIPIHLIAHQLNQRGLTGRRHGWQLRVCSSAPLLVWLSVCVHALVHTCVCEPGCSEFYTW